MSRRLNVGDELYIPAIRTTCVVVDSEQGDAYKALVVYPGFADDPQPLYQHLEYEIIRRNLTQQSTPSLKTTG